MLTSRLVSRSVLRAFGAGILSMALIVSGCGSSGDGGSTGGEPPTDPGPTDPGPTDPGPTDPGPTDPGPTDPGPTDPGPGEPTCDVTYDSTYAAIQDIVFERRGCTADACHGSGASGALDLRADVSYANLFDAPSVASDLSRVHPGTKERSFLWWKLLAAKDASVEVAGSPMPLGTDPLTDDELDLVRLWIQAGAPEEGTVLDSEALVNGCLPEPEPILIEPLAAPDPSEGVQLELPPFDLIASSETEVCIPTWFDLTDVVPDEFKTPDGKFFYWSGFEIRQDPSSHHLLVQTPITAFSGADIDPSLVDGWSCLRGPRHGESCDPLDENACGDGGFCTGPVEFSTACSGYEPAPSVTTISFTGTQQAQFQFTNYPGVFAIAPIKGLIFWNSHAFNLTTSDTQMHARVNWIYAKDRRWPIQRVNDPGFGIARLIFEGARPFTESTMCSEEVLPKGAHVTRMNSHTHKRGKRFWYELLDGTLLYESFVYNDPLEKHFDPPLVLDSDDPAERTIRWCSLYNNGVDEDGNPDPETVTRASRIPYAVSLAAAGLENIGLCEPTQCVNEGAIGRQCNDRIDNQRGDDAACDTSPGAGDGVCDACRIMGGVTTENEMFGPDIGYFVPEDE